MAWVCCELNTAATDSETDSEALIPDPASETKCLESFHRQEGLHVSMDKGVYKYVEARRALIQRNGLGERTLLPGMRYGRDRIAALRDADLFVLPKAALSKRLLTIVLTKKL